jgi:hypothetical protein
MASSFAAPFNPRELCRRGGQREEAALLKLLGMLIRVVIRPLNFLRRRQIALAASAAYL